MSSLLIFQSDFGIADGAVSAMYGVVKSVDRSLEIFDGTHEIPHFDMERILSAKSEHEVLAEGHHICFGCGPSRGDIQKSLRGQNL